MGGSRGRISAHHNTSLFKCTDGRTHDATRRRRGRRRLPRRHARRRVVVERAARIRVLVLSPEGNAGDKPGRRVREEGREERQAVVVETSARFPCDFRPQTPRFASQRSPTVIPTYQPAGRGVALMLCFGGVGICHGISHGTWKPAVPGGAVASGVVPHKKSVSSVNKHLSLVNLRVRAGLGVG